MKETVNSAIAGSYDPIPRWKALGVEAPNGLPQEDKETLLSDHALSFILINCLQRLSCYIEKNKQILVNFSSLSLSYINDQLVIAVTPPSFRISDTHKTVRALYSTSSIYNFHQWNQDCNGYEYSIRESIKVHIARAAHHRLSNMMRELIDIKRSQSQDPLNRKLEKFIQTYHEYQRSFLTNYCIPLEYITQQLACYKEQLRISIRYCLQSRLFQLLDKEMPPILLFASVIKITSHDRKISSCLNLLTNNCQCS